MYGRIPKHPVLMVYAPTLCILAERQAALPLQPWVSVMPAGDLQRMRSLRGVPHIEDSTSWRHIDGGPNAENPKSRIFVEKVTAHHGWRLY